LAAQDLTPEIREAPLMPFNGGAVGSDHFALGNVHPLAAEPGTVHLKLATFSALDERTDDDGRRSGVTVNRPASKAYSVRRVMSERVL
jgi:hypothetical protein